MMLHYPGNWRAIAPAVLVAATAILTTSSLAAQRTRDEARLTVGIAVGGIGGADLWSVQQPVRAPSVGGQSRQDIFDLAREIRPALSVALQGAYFPGPHVGITGEVTYIGLGTHDKCTLVSPSGYFINEAACSSINNRDRSPSAVAFLGGAILRPFSRATWQPYARTLIGASLVPRSTVEVVALFDDEGSADALPIYPSQSEKQLRPSGLLGIGVISNASRGYQVRAEVRNTWVSLATVTGPASVDGVMPPTHSEIKGFFGFLVGFDIVLEKHRGRRY